MWTPQWSKLKSGLLTTVRVTIPAVINKINKTKPPPFKYVCYTKRRKRREEIGFVGALGVFLQ